MATKPAPVKKTAATSKKVALIAKKPTETMTLKSVFEQIGESHDMSKKQSHNIAAELVEAVTTILRNGDRIRMSGIGILEVKDRPARTGRNPATGESIQIAASRKVAFRAAKELKALV